MRDFGLVVIGAHFGVWLSEKISSYNNSNILLVEPVPYNYKILQNEFRENKNILICTNAIFSGNFKKSFYFVKEESIPKLGKHWASGIGSYDKQHILNHKSKRFDIQDQDIEKIDVEGAEYEILKSIDFKKIDIKSIQFESKHFDGTFNEGPKLTSIKEKLSENGYNLTQIDKENILAKK